MVLIDEKIKELILIASSVACHCHPCLNKHLNKANELKIPKEDVIQVVELAINCSRTGIRNMHEFSRNSIDEIF